MVTPNKGGISKNLVQCCNQGQQTLSLTHIKLQLTALARTYDILE